MATPNFEEKGRLPVRPLSYDNKDIACLKEIIVDYNDGTIYIKTASGEIINAAVSGETLTQIINYLKENGEVITQVTIVKEDGTNITIEAALKEIYSALISIDNTLTKEGYAADAKIVGDLIKKCFNKDGGELTGPIIMPNSTPIYAKNTNDEDIVIGYIGTDNRLHLSSSTIGIVFDGPIILSSESFGFDDPSTKDAVEGQVYVKLIEE